jgi:hypothetical protein
MSHANFVLSVGISSSFVTPDTITPKIVPMHRMIVAGVGLQYKAK